jgi:Leucine-rich repeat (LRR) protein
MTKTELKKNITKIKKFLKQRDYDIIDTGIELARGLDEPAVFEALLGGWSINDEGKLVLEEGYKGETLTKRWSYESWPYFAYALLNLIGYASKNTKVDKSLEHANIKTLYLTDYSCLASGLANLPKLTSVVLYGCDSLQNVDGLANLTNLTSLDLRWCKSLQNVDLVDIYFPHLTMLDLSDCDSLQNVDGLANCTNLTSLNLTNCISLQYENMCGLANLNNLEILYVSNYEYDEKYNRKDWIAYEYNTREIITKFQKNINIFIAIRDNDQNILSKYKNITKLSLLGNFYNPSGNGTSIQNVDGLAFLTNLISLDLSNCDSLQNIDGLAKLTKLTSLDLNNCGSLQNVDGLANCTNLTNLDLGQCGSLQNIDGLANCTNLTSLNLRSWLRDSQKTKTAISNLESIPDRLANCTKLTSLDLSYWSQIQNVDGLAKLTNLTSLDLRWCKSLQNVDGLANLNNLTQLVLESDRIIRPIPLTNFMYSRVDVASYQEEIRIMKSIRYEILKSSEPKLPKSLKSKTPKDLKSKIAKINFFITKRDYATIDQGIELLRGLNDPFMFEILLDGCAINEDAELIRNRLFTGTGPAQPFLDYALLNLIGYAPDNTEIDASIIRSNIRYLNLQHTKMLFLPSGLGEFTNLVFLDLSYSSHLITSRSQAFTHLDALSNCKNLKSLDLTYCKSLQNIDGLANLPNLTSLNLWQCHEKIRNQWAEIKKSMK